MAALDCVSFNSAVQSCAAILGLAEGKVLTSIRAVASDCEQSGPGNSLDFELLIRERFGICSDELPTLSEVYWFHGTRVLPGTRFQEGLLPLSRALDHIWCELGKLVRDWSSREEWSSFRNAYLSEDDAFHKRLHIQDEGPYAFLVRETFLDRDQLNRNWDYLRIPEAVDDICTYYERKTGHNLRALFVAATCPSIVKFRSTDSDSDDLVHALKYILFKVMEAGIPACADYGGPAVGPAAVISVESGFLGETSCRWRGRLLAGGPSGDGALNNFQV